MFYTGPALSSACDTWGTPQALFDELDAEFHFETDVCALPSNAKCAHYFTPEIDGLAQEWHGVCWMNPPYGRQTGVWLRKAYEESQRGATVVCLIPARTDTAYWHDYCMKGEVRFLRGRLRFERERERGTWGPGGPLERCPFPIRNRDLPRYGMTLLLTPAATRFLSEMQLLAARSAMRGEVDFIPAGDYESAAEYGMEVYQALESDMLEEDPKYPGKGVFFALVDGRPCAFEKRATPAPRRRR